MLNAILAILWVGLVAVWLICIWPPTANTIPSIIIAFFAPPGFWLAAQNYIHNRTREKERIKQKEIAAQISAFITDGEKLRSRREEDPLPIQEHNEWVDLVAKYLTDELGVEYEVRFNNHHGITSYGDGSDKSNYSNSLDNRIQRLLEILKEIAEK